MADKTATIGIIVTTLVAIVGFAAKYLNDLKIEKKKGEIRLVSDQVQYLYGPLSALAAANEAAWITFTKKYFPHKQSVFGHGNLIDNELALWRQWMTEVFMPLNRAMVEVILKNTHLIDESEFPQPFSQLIAHVKTYEILLSNWSRSDYSEHIAFSNYPNEINDYAHRKFKDIKARQLRLLS